MLISLSTIDKTQNVDEKKSPTFYWGYAKSIQLINNGMGREGDSLNTRNWDSVNNEDHS